MVILSYNISSRKSKNRRFLAGIGDVIRASRADIACLQGVKQGSFIGFTGSQPVWLGERLGMEFVYHGRSGNLLLSKYTVTSTYLHALADGGLLEASLSAPSGTLSVFCTRWSEDSAVRMKQAAETAEIVKFCPDARILCGDLVENETGSAVGRLIEETGLIDLPASAGCSLPTFPSSAPDVRRDYILGAGEFSVSEAWVIDSQIADHRPVAVRLGT